MKGHHRRLLQQSNKKGDGPSLGSKRRKAPGALTKGERRDARAREKNKAWLLNSNAEHDQGEKDEFEEDAEEDSDGQLIRPSEADESRVEAAKRLKQEEATARKEERKLTKKAQEDVELYYKDPLQLANGVVQRLKGADIEGALRLVRSSEAFDIKNIVSWNHCIDWLMSQGDVKDALKVYNEMKKRGHKPDAYTYTIMLRGLSQHVDQPNVVKEAVKVYNSIFAPNSAVKPNTIHTNAVVNVCARGGDMDSLWAIAGKLPEKGPGSPDRLTYTLILNAIRENTIKETAKTADKVKYGGDAQAAADSRAKMFAQAVADGRKLWEDISYRWRRANLVIDEQLVCAMGRLLLGCGVGKDIGQVLDLVEGTMRLRIPERQSKSKQPSPFGGPSNPRDEEDFVGAEETTGKAVMPLKESNVYATPGHNTLSMLLEACFTYKPIRNFAPSYWHYMTSILNIEPDAANITAYLRILRMNRASTRAYELLAKDWPVSVSKRLYRRGTFVIAFAACARDKLNPNVFDTARKLLRLMQDRLEENEIGMFDEGIARGELKGKARKVADKKMKEELRGLGDKDRAERQAQMAGAESLPIDPKILQYFVELAVDTTQGWNEGFRGKDDGEVFERHPARNHTIIALRTVAPLSGQLKRLLKAKLEEMEVESNSRRSKTPRVAEKVNELIDLMRAMIGAYDKVLDMAERLGKGGKEALDASLMSDFNSKKREYTAYVARIEKTMGRKVLHADAYAEPRDTKQKARKRDEDEEEDEEDAEPDIERRIRAVLEGVDARVVRERHEKKGFNNDFFPEQKTELKIHSRKQQQTRDALLAEGMERNLGRTDYGVLNEELGIETGPASRRRLEVRERRRNLGQPTNTKSAKPRRPMIGDELGLEDEDDDVSASRHNQRSDDTSTTFSAFNSQASPTEVNDRSLPSLKRIRRQDEFPKNDGADWMLKQQRTNTRPMGRGILGHDEVRRAWAGERSAAGI